MIDNIEDITEEDADDHAVGLQMKIKELKRKLVNVKKPKENAFQYLRDKKFFPAPRNGSRKDLPRGRPSEEAKENEGSGLRDSDHKYTSTIRIPNRFCCP